MSSLTRSTLLVTLVLIVATALLTTAATTVNSTTHVSFKRQRSTLSVLRKRQQVEAAAVVPGESGYAASYSAAPNQLGSCRLPIEARITNRVQLPIYALRDPTTGNEHGSCGKCVQVCFRDQITWVTQECRQYFVAGLCTDCHRGNVVIEESGMPAGQPGPSGVAQVNWNFVDCSWSKVGPRS
ncbi:hypothetical protein RI367_002101 [Sorochytrium milnesiophthora]